MKRKAIASLLAGVLAATAVGTVSAAEKRSFCVWDPLGATGPIFNQMKNIRTQALSWGYDLTLRSYTDEAIAANDFRAGQCDAVLLTDIRTRDFNKFTATLVAVGALPTATELKIVLETLSQPKAAPLMVNDKYEIAGLMPAGGIHVFTRDRKIHSVETIQGKKIATFDYDPSSMTMVQHVGASAVPSSTSNFAGKFNNGSVDVCYAPAIAYKPLELYKGVEPNGGVYTFTFAQMTYQMTVQKDRFSPEFSQQSRTWFYNNFDQFMEFVRQAEADIPDQYWIEPTPMDAAGFDSMLKGVRVALKNEGVYDPRALNLMLKARCKTDPTRAECAEGSE